MTRRPPASRALVVSFDDVLLRDPTARTVALRDALVAMDVGEVVDVDTLHPHLVGATFREAVQTVLRAHPIAHADPTRLELVALDAAARWRARVQQGVEVNPRVVDLLHRAVRGGPRMHVVVRADSDRREAERVVGHAGLEPVVALLRAADDPVVPGTRYHQSAERSWEAIAHRLGRWGVTVPRCRLLEAAALRSRARRVMTDTGSPSDPAPV